jgi:hypothetical protein
VLPKAARPAHIIWRTVFAGFSFGELAIDPNGHMHFTYGAGRPDLQASLDGVSYPVAGVTWHRLGLVNGWQPFSKLNNWGDPAYAVKGGVVYLSGVVRQAVGTNREFAVLPKAARPGRKMYFTIDSWFGASPGTMVISPNGAMIAASSPQSGAQTFTSLDALSYPAPGTTWHSLPVRNGWQIGSKATGGPAYAVKAGVAYLTGSVRRPTLVGVPFAALPAAIRPIDDLLMLAYTGPGNPGNIGVVPGNGLYGDGPAPVFVALTGTAYPLSS